MQPLLQLGERVVVRGATVRRFGLQLVPLALLVLPLTLGVRPTTVTSEPGPDHSQP